MSKISAGAMIGILAGLLGCERADLVLTAAETVSVYSTLDDATDGEAIEFATLQKGEVGTVVGCTLVESRC